MLILRYAEQRQRLQTRRRGASTAPW